MEDRNPANPSLRIGKAAALGGVSIDTLRYYERLGLLPKAPRTIAGYRLYDQRTVDRLRFIKRAQTFGFSLEEIKQLMRLERSAPQTCSRVLETIRHKLEDLDRRYREIGRLKRELTQFKSACERALAGGQSCPVIDDFVEAPTSQSRILRVEEPHFPIRATESDQVKQILQSACSLARLTEKLSGLRRDENQVLRSVLGTYPRIGRAPKMHELRGRFPQYSLSQLNQICRKLHELDLLYIPEGSNEIAGAYPFIDFRKEHRVRFNTGGKVTSAYAMCAIDALGIPFMYRKDLDIESSCGYCKKNVTLAVRRRKIASCEPADTVVFAGLSCTAHAAVSLCTTVLFFCSEAHLHTWHTKHGKIPGVRLTLGEALALGKKLFENRLK